MTEWVEELAKLDPKATMDKTSAWKDSDVSIDKVIFADQDHPTEVTRQIFLAGPTPRDQETPTWRPEAVKILRDLGYDGHIFVPEDSSTVAYENYDKQIDWEQKAIRRSDCVLFWVPRELEKMPGFTTNVEFGDCLQFGNVVLGYPDGAVKVRYLAARAQENHLPVATTLDEACLMAVAMAGDPNLRKDGETSVPNYIWESPAFQKWYTAQRDAGNKLVHSEVDWVFRIPSIQKVFSFALKAQVYVADEDRIKDNEFLLSRSDIGAALLYYKEPTSLRLDKTTKIVLVKEFRTPARTPDGFVLELPSGSSLSDKDMYQVAMDELEEETTIGLNRDRFKFHTSRQLAATLSSHHACLVSTELTAEELARFESLKGQQIVGKEATEKTYVEVRTLGELLEPGPNDFVDFTTLGMILQALLA